MEMIESVRQLWENLRASLPRELRQETVRYGWECPECHENRMDWLAWRDDEMVQCGSCSTFYVPVL